MMEQAEKTFKSQDTNYWNSVSNNWLDEGHNKLIRLVSDLLNYQLFDHWLSKEEYYRLLKTDLFDESLTDGLTPLLSMHAKNVVGIDISASTLETAKRKTNSLQVAAADVRNLPFATDSFDTIVSNSTLDHFKSLDEIIRSLKELKRVLKKDGQLLITFDNYTNPAVFLRNALPFKLLNRIGILPYYVGVTFGALRLKSVLEKLNFSVVEVTTFWHFPRIILAAMAGVFDKYLSDKFRRKILNGIMSFECLSKFPTKCFTGHFVAANAINRGLVEKTE